MTKSQAHQRIIKLRKLINHHRYLYHVLDKQEISEPALDSLKKELFDLEQRYPEFITTDSPTQRIGGKPLEKFEKVQHSSPMLSFNDAFSEKDIMDWEQRIKKLLAPEEVRELNYFAEPKIDGLAVSLVYKKGILQKGATRGNGRVGENVTQNLKTIESIPLHLQQVLDCEIRGEVYISKKGFKKFAEQYANPRNLAAGSIRQLDSKIAASRNLNFLAWQLLDRETQAQEQEELKVLGFKSAKGKYCSNLSAVFSYYQEVLEKREKIPYQIDGLVINVNNNRLFKKLGVVGKAPRAAIAFKFPLKQATTIIENIQVQIGRTGAITPVALLKPVKIGGVTVTRATLHNEDEIKRLGVKIHDTVIVGRAGDVIPRVVKPLKELRTGKEKEFKMPKNCPVCETSLQKQITEAVWRCPNLQCQVRRKKQLCHFVSKSAFDIEGLGPKIIDQLLNEGLISDAAELFELNEGDLVPLERFAEKSAENLVNSIQSRKTISLARFIFALGIRGVGQETAQLLSQQISNFQFSISNLKAQPVEWFMQIKDIGPIVAKSIYIWFHNKQNLKLLDRLLKYIKIEKPELGIKNKKLRGKIFVLTGTLKMLSREEAKERIRNLGGDISGTVSKNTDFVVAGSNPGSKLARAKTLGIKTLSEQAFLEMLM